jgi:hypothetical protein
MISDFVCTKYETKCFVPLGTVSYFRSRSPYEIVFRGQSYINVYVVQIYAFAALDRVYDVAI